MENMNTALDSELMKDFGLLQPDEDSKSDETDLDDIEIIEVNDEDDEEDIVDSQEGGDGSSTQENKNEDSKTETESLILDGEEISIDTIKEWQKGYLRQSDYTKKTQEIAAQRNEQQKAIELYNYLKENPQLVETLRDAETNVNPTLLSSVSPQNQQIEALIRNQKTIETELKLRDLKEKYGDVDEVSLFQKAEELGTDDLDAVYKIISYDNKQNIDADTLKEQIRQEILAEIAKDKESVNTTISTKQMSTAKPTATVTAEEKKVAEGMGLSLKEYVKWRDK